MEWNGREKGEVAATTSVAAAARLLRLGHIAGARYQDEQTVGVTEPPQQELL